MCATGADKQAAKAATPPPAAAGNGTAVGEPENMQGGSLDDVTMQLTEQEIDSSSSGGCVRAREPEVKSPNKSLQQKPKVGASPNQLDFAKKDEYTE